jgi:heme oxygenase
MMLKRLKAATSSRHTALEKLLPLLDADLSSATYRHFVQKMFGFYEPLEASLLATPWWGELDLDVSLRHKTPRLLQDLRALGDTEADIAALPRCQHLPPLTNQAQLWGCLYVIEGATLGGQIIIKRLNAQLALSATSGASFFDGYGPQTGARWKTFCAALSAQGEGVSGGSDAMLASANRTFDTLSHWLFPASFAAPASDG